MTTETSNQPKPKAKEPQKPPPTAETVTAEFGSHAVGRATAGAGVSPTPHNQTRLNPTTSVFTSIVMRQMASGMPLEMPGHKTARGLRETALLRMQQQQGNTAVQHLVARSGQREHSYPEQITHERQWPAPGLKNGQDAQIQSAIHVSRQNAPLVQRFEAQHHEHIERGSLSGAMPGGAAGFTDAEATATYFGNWSRDLSQAFTNNPIVDAFGKELVFEILNAVAMQKFGRELSPRDFGIYSPREHIDNPAGQTNLDLLRGRQREFLQFGAGEQPQNPEEDISNPATISALFTVNEAGLPAYLGRSIQYVEEELTQAANLGRTADGLMHFGNGLHTAEDLAAHSNFIEIAIGKLFQEGALTNISAELAEELNNRTRPEGEGGEGLQDPVETFAARTVGGRPILMTGTFVTADTLISLSEAITAFLQEFDPFTVGNDTRSQQTMTMILSRYETLAQTGEAGLIIQSSMTALGTTLTEKLAEKAQQAVAGEQPGEGASWWQRAAAAARGVAGRIVGGALRLAGSALNTGWIQEMIAGAVNRFGNLPLVEVYKFVIEKKNAISDFFDSVDQRLQQLPFYNEIKELVKTPLRALREQLKSIIQAAVRFIGQLIQKAFAESEVAATNIESQIQQQIQENVKDPAARQQILNATPEQQRSMIQNPEWQARAQMSDADFERLRQMILAPDYVWHGPSHSQIAKDHADSPFFGTAAAMASAAVTELRNHMVAVWQSEGHNAQTDPTLQQNYASEIPPDVAARLAPPGTPESAMTPEQRQAAREAAEAAPHFKEWQRRQEGEVLLREGGIAEGEESHGVDEAYTAVVHALQALVVQLNVLPTQLRQAADQIARIAPETAVELRTLADELPQGLDEIAEVLAHATSIAELQQLAIRLRELAREKQGLVSRAQSILRRAATRIEELDPTLDRIAANLANLAGVLSRLLPQISRRLQELAAAVEAKQTQQLRSQEQIRRIHQLAPVQTGEWDSQLGGSHAEAAPGRSDLSPERQALFNYVRQEIFAHPYDSTWWRAPLLNWCNAPHNRERLEDYIRARNSEQMHHHH
ncbi:MAG: hypothetical protein HND44_14110 [Chloroflexi bacterium]|nr:hypothetical protein [Chloroflexota bacterium]NOG35691.1 hypothetical protein [Chloroflexota bacterium]